jgi:Caspase domain
MPRRTALLIATDTYASANLRQLRAPQNDAAELAEVLGDLEIGGYDVSLCINEPIHQVRLEIERVFVEASRDDLVLLYISGHGVKDQAGRQLYFAMQDTRTDRLRTTGVAAQFISDSIDDSMAGQVAVWLDCCYAGLFPAGLNSKSDESVDVLGQLHIRSGRGRAVMTASTAIQYAYETDHFAAVPGEEYRSVFTSAIVRGLKTGDADRNRDGVVDSAELYDYVYDEVRTTTPRQTPMRNDQLTGDLYIALSKRGLPVDPSLPVEVQQALRSMYPPIQQGGVEVLTGLAINGDHAARETLVQLSGASNQRLAKMADLALEKVPDNPWDDPRERPNRDDSAKLIRLHESIATLLASRGEWQQAYQHLRSIIDIKTLDEG